MTQITYRGVKYDAEQYKAKVLADATATNRFNLMYRDQSGEESCGGMTMVVAEISVAIVAVLSLIYGEIISSIRLEGEYVRIKFNLEYDLPTYDL